MKMMQPTKILLIDDEERMCESLKTLLEMEGYEVQSFTDSVEAIKSFPGSKFDLVISDIKMPGVDGLEILKKAHEHDPYLEVILMTGYASLQSAKDAVDKGAFSYLTKPLEFEELKISVTRSLEKRQIALEKDRLLSELKKANILLEQKLAEIDALYSAGTILASTIDLTETLSQILSLAIDVIGAKIGSVMILDHEKNELYIGAACGLSEEIVLNTRMKLGSSIAGHVAKSGEPLVVENIEKDSRFSRINRQHYESKSLISVPLKYKGQIHGVINLNNKLSGTNFTEHDLKVLTTFASQAAIAVDRATVFHDRGEKINELTILLDIARDISLVDKPSKIGDIILKQLRKLIHIEAITWYSYSDRAKLFRLEFANSTPGNEYNYGSLGELEINKEVIGSLKSDDIDFIRDKIMKAFAENHPERKVAIEVIPVQMHGAISNLMVIISEQEIDSAAKNLATLVANQAAAVYERQKAVSSGMKLVTMGKMISEICHDLKKPLTNLKGNVQVYRNKIKGKEADEFFDSSNKEINRLNDLVMEMVDFANPNKYSTQKEDIELLVEKAVKLLERDIDRKNIKLSISKEKDTPKVIINNKEIFEVLINIMLNGIEAMDPGGSLGISIGRHPESEPYVRLAISDTGCGIPEEDWARVFDRYYTTKETGTGLGLAIVERVVDAHSGKMSVNSEMGKGTTFNIDLPV